MISTVAYVQFQPGLQYCQNIKKQPQHELQRGEKRDAGFVPGGRPRARASRGRGAGGRPGGVASDAHTPTRSCAHPPSAFAERPQCPRGFWASRAGAASRHRLWEAPWRHLVPPQRVPKNGPVGPAGGRGRRHVSSHGGGRPPGCPAGAREDRESPVGRSDGKGGGGEPLDVRAHLQGWGAVCTQPAAAAPGPPADPPGLWAPAALRPTGVTFAPNKGVTSTENKGVVLERARPGGQQGHDGFRRCRPGPLHGAPWRPLRTAGQRSLTPPPRPQMCLGRQRRAACSALSQPASHLWSPRPGLGLHGRTRSGLVPRVFGLCF